MFQQALHRVTWSVSWNFLNFRCETSFMKSRTAFYFCNGSQRLAKLRKKIRNRNKSAMIHFETNFNVPEQVSTFYVTWCNACWDLFRSAVAHKFQLKVSTCNGYVIRPWKIYGVCQVGVPTDPSIHVNQRPPLPSILTSICIRSTFFLHRTQLEIFRITLAANGKRQKWQRDQVYPTFVVLGFQFPFEAEKFNDILHYSHVCTRFYEKT